MTTFEFNEKLNTCKHEHLLRVMQEDEKYKNELEAVKLNFAKSNNDIEVGDVVSDMINAIKIDAIDYNTNLALPCAVYKGYKAVSNNSEITTLPIQKIILQSNVRMRNGKPYRYAV